MSGDMDTIYVGDKSIAELEQLWNCQVEDDDFYDVISHNIFLADNTYIPARIGEYTDRRLRGAIFGLGGCITSIINREEILVSFLDHPNPLIVSEAIDALRKSSALSYWSIIGLKQNHKSEYIRGATLRYARCLLEPVESATILIKALSDISPVVRQNAIDELSELKDRRAIVMIMPYLSDPNPEVVQAAKYALNTLTRLA